VSSLPCGYAMTSASIGCEICVRVCEKLAWDAIVMRPTEGIEEATGMVIHERFPPEGEAP